MYCLIRFLFMILLVCSSITARAIDLSCNPKESCIKKLPFGVKVEDPKCQIRRAACRLKCGPLNDDANRYINKYKQQQSTINKSIVDLEEHSVRNKEELESLVKTSDNVKILCESLNEYQSEILVDVNSKYQFIQALKTILELKDQDQNELVIHVESLDLDARLKKQIVTVVLFFNGNLHDIEALLNDYVGSKSVPLDFLIKNVLSNCLINSSKIAETSEFISGQIKAFDEKITENRHEIEKLNKEIDRQEKRKCPSNLF